MDIRAVDQITKILREHGGTLVNEEWQTLKTAVLGTTTNMPTTPCQHRFVIFTTEVRCGDCGAVYQRLG